MSTVTTDHNWREVDMLDGSPWKHECELGEALAHYEEGAK